MTLEEQEFYVHLSYLYYYVVMADKRVEKAEKLRLKSVIDNNWSDSSSTGNEVMYEQLKKLFIEKPSPRFIWEVFEAYFKEHPNKFTKEIKQKIYQTADEIAGSFAGRNKSELIAMSQILLLFQKS